MIAIIPARGGSKGLPGKNIMLLDGKPLIAHTIEAALGSKYITEVIVSTDSREIEEVALLYGAASPFLRPAALATDEAMAIDTYTYTLERLEKERGMQIPHFAVLQPTSPLRRVEDIDGAVELFLIKNADSVISYTQEHHPIAWHKYITEEGRFENIFPENISNRQKIRPSYYPNGSIYVFNHELIKQGKYYGDNSYAYVMPRNFSADIDTLDDFRHAEFLLERNLNE